MRLDVLPVRFAGAAENMAVDFMLLQGYPEADRARLRHYGWRSKAFTFGYSQRYREVEAALRGSAKTGGGGEGDGSPLPLDLCRRPTGGGIVDHSDDWTYALVAPRGSVLAEMRAVDSYRAIHQALAAALLRQGVPAELAQTPVSGDLAALCFAKSERFDVIHRGTGEKLAGAAQKRNKRGLLCQGSLWRPATNGAAVDGEALLDDFAAEVAAVLGAEPGSSPWPDWNEEEVSALTDQYASPDWIGMR